MATYRYFKYICSDCEHDFEEMCDITDGSDTDKASCPKCNGEAPRAPAFTLNKGELEEKTWGGRMTGGKLYRQHTGFNEVAEQRAAEKRLKKAQREKNKDEVVDAKKEIKRLQDKAKKEATK